MLTTKSRGIHVLSLGMQFCVIDLKQSRSRPEDNVDKFRIKRNLVTGINKILQVTQDAVMFKVDKIAKPDSDITSKKLMDN